MTKKVKKIIIEVQDDGYCEIDTIYKDGTYLSETTRTPSQAVGAVFRQLVADKDLYLKLFNWIDRLNDYDAEFVDVLLYQKFEELAELSTKALKKLYHNK